MITVIVNWQNKHRNATMKAALKISIKRMVYRVDLHRDGVFDIYATRCYPANLNDNRGVSILSEIDFAFAGGF